MKTYCNITLLNTVTYMIGKVKWFDTKRGYGFITGSNGVDVYVHYTAICSDGFKNLKHNWTVEFDIIATDDGRTEARNVVIMR